MGDVKRIDGVAEPLLWNLRRLVDEYGAGGVRKALDLMDEWPDNNEGTPPELLVAQFVRDHADEIEAGWPELTALVDAALPDRPTTYRREVTR